jgi:hypothetical protein
MTSRYVQPDDIYKRYETHHKKVMTLYVTRQNQQFVIASDITLCDLRLIRSSVELVGEPGTSVGQAGIGLLNSNQTGGGQTQGAGGGPGYSETVNNTLLNEDLTNAIQHKPSINHGWMNIEIEGMSQARNFMRDDRKLDNELSIVVPTDNGLIASRVAQQNGPPHALILENIKLEQNIRIACQFAGSGAKQARAARFVEDWVDLAPGTYRSVDGTAKFYVDDGGASNGECQIPANLVNCMILQFEMTPRSTI